MCQSLESQIWLSEITPNAPTTSGIAVTLFNCHIRLISTLNIWYFSIFSSSFSFTLESPGTAMSLIFTSSLLLSTKIYYYYFFIIISLRPDLLLVIPDECEWQSGPAKTRVSWRGEWPSGPAKTISFSEVKHGCLCTVRNWMGDLPDERPKNSSLRHPSEGTLN